MINLLLLKVLHVQAEILQGIHMWMAKRSQVRVAVQEEEKKRKQHNEREGGGGSEVGQSL